MDKSRLGKCYELAAKHIDDHRFTDGSSDLLLVHGKIGPNRNPHAWLMWSSEERFPGIDRTFHMEWVWEPVGETILPREAFEKLYTAVIDCEYNSEEAYQMMCRHQTYGPWEGVPV